MKIPLLTGAYEARSLIASAQRCVNLYPESNPQDSETPVTHYPTSGLVKLSLAPAAGCRGLYRATTGTLYGVYGDQLCSIDTSTWAFTALGTVGTDTGPVWMKDNSLSLALVDGSNYGYAVDFTTNAFSSIADPAFYGSSSVSIIDDFLIFNQPGTRQFYVSGALALSFDALDIASKNGAPDKTVACAVVNRRIWILGERTTEVWYNSGSADFVFSRDPGVFIEHGCASAASVVATDTSIYWVSPKGIIFRSNEMSALRISTHAIEEELRTYARIDDARGDTYVENGHTFYQVSFPSADKTWCFDLESSQWHEKMWLDTEGGEHRHRAGCIVEVDNRRFCGDWETADFYELTPDAVDDAGVPMLHIRSAPTLSNEKKEIFLDRLFADMQVGESDVNADEPLARLRWSDTRGRTWGNAISRGMGKRGQFDVVVQFNRLGQSKERVFELAWSAPVKTALNALYVVSGDE